MHSSTVCLVCNPSEPTSKLNTLCSHLCIWRCWLNPPREAVSPRRSQTEEAHRNSVSLLSAQILSSKSSFQKLWGKAQRCRFAQQGRAQGSNKKITSLWKWLALERNGCFNFSLLGKFPFEALMFLSPVMKRSTSKEGEKEDTVPKFLP